MHDSPVTGIYRNLDGTVYFYNMDMYFIALVAPEDIGVQVLKWKTWMKDKYLCEVALRSPAHITLVPPFWMKVELEEKLIGDISEFSASQKNVLVTLNDFSHFKSRVIFIDVVPNEQLTQLQKDLTAFLREAGQYPVKEDDRAFHPHLTIATRDLYKKAFDEAWAIFKNKKFSADWMVKGISLLKYNKRAWDIIANAEFGVVK